MTVAKPQLSEFLNTIQRVSRFSSAVEQRFCKPKVGSSILSTGTSETRCFIGLFAISGHRRKRPKRRTAAVSTGTKTGTFVLGLFAVGGRSPDDMSRTCEGGRCFCGAPITGGRRPFHHE